MQATLELTQMSTSEKLRLMEALWDDLCRNEQSIPVADWHKEELENREEAVRRGDAKFVDLNTAKKNIAERIARDRRST